LSVDAVFVRVAGGLLFQFLSALLEQDWGVGFTEEEEAGGCVYEADDGQNPKDPAPAGALDDEAAKERALLWC
jgi:hypothetical protein